MHLGQKTAELLLIGDAISSGRAQIIGLVNRLTTPDELMPVFHALAANIAAKPPMAVRYAKLALRDSSQTPPEDQQAWETSCFEAVWGSPEWERHLENYFGTTLLCKMGRPIETLFYPYHEHMLPSRRRIK